MPGISRSLQSRFSAVNRRRFARVLGVYAERVSKAWTPFLSWTNDHSPRITETHDASTFQISSAVITISLSYRRFFSRIIVSRRSNQARDRSALVPDDDNKTSSHRFYSTFIECNFERTMVDRVENKISRVDSWRVHRVLLFCSLRYTRCSCFSDCSFDFRFSFSLFLSHAHSLVSSLSPLPPSKPFHSFRFFRSFPSHKPSFLSLSLSLSHARAHTHTHSLSLFLSHIHTHVFGVFGRTYIISCKLRRNHRLSHFLWTKIFRQEYNSGIKNFSTLKNTNLS